jgi:hypothetical protein
VRGSADPGATTLLTECCTIYNIFRWLRAFRFRFAMAFNELRICSHRFKGQNHGHIAPSPSWDELFTLQSFTTYSCICISLGMKNLFSMMFSGISRPNLIKLNLQTETKVCILLTELWIAWLSHLERLRASFLRDWNQIIRKSLQKHPRKREYLLVLHKWAEDPLWRTVAAWLSRSRFISAAFSFVCRCTRARYGSEQGMDASASLPAKRIREKAHC